MFLPTGYAAIGRSVCIRRKGTDRQRQHACGVPNDADTILPFAKAADETKFPQATCRRCAEGSTAAAGTNFRTALFSHAAADIMTLLQRPRLPA